jgi:Flp pilus assembly protein TadB
MLEQLGAKAIAIIVAVAAAIFIIWAAFHFYEKSRSQGAQARVERSQADAAANSGADAVGTVARSGEAAAASEEMTRENEQQIRNAKGANDPVSDASTAAGKAAYCKRDAYKDKPYCKGGGS